MSRISRDFLKLLGICEDIVIAHKMSEEDYEKMKDMVEDNGDLLQARWNNEEP